MVYIYKYIYVHGELHERRTENNTLVLLSKIATRIFARTMVVDPWL